ncbi:auxin-responsive protein IAA32-like [Populus alba x Populus x berolinensis]|nr:auxin-responsive protein IAA32-like [Populus alba x Populus x berolinensis]
MDSNASGFLLNPPALHSTYYQPGEDDGIIDLGLSLRTLQPEAYHPSGHLVGLEGYGDLMDWPQANSPLKHSTSSYIRFTPPDCDEEAEGVQSRDRWAYVKVNIDGVIVGRKICILDHGGYSSLALQLEDMFGRQSASGLRLFQAGSEFCLFYKDREENWRTVGDVPWNLIWLAGDLDSPFGLLGVLLFRHELMGREKGIFFPERGNKRAAFRAPAAAFHRRQQLVVGKCYAFDLHSHNILNNGHCKKMHDKALTPISPLQCPLIKML